MFLILHRFPRSSLEIGMATIFEYSLAVGASNIFMSGFGDGAGAICGKEFILAFLANIFASTLI
jgi:hypothetical protein